MLWKQICQGKTQLLYDSTPPDRLITAPDLRSSTRQMPEQQVQCSVPPDAYVKYRKSMD